MDPISALTTLALVQLAAVMSPGPSFFLLTRIAATRGRSIALQAVLGATTAALLWATAALFGLAILFEQARWLMKVLQIAGGAYIIWLGIKLWRKPASATTAPTLEGNAFLQGFTTSVANPKLILFFGSILSLVFDPHLPTWTRIAALAIVAINEIAWYSSVVYVFSTRRAQTFYLRIERTLDRIFGTLFLGFGAKLVWSSRD